MSRENSYQYFVDGPRRMCVYWYYTEGDTLQDEGVTMALITENIDGKVYVQVESLVHVLGDAASVLAITGVLGGYENDSKESEAIGMTEGYIAVMKMLSDA